MSNPDKIEVELMKVCEDAKGKDHRFVSSEQAKAMLL